MNINKFKHIRKALVVRNPCPLLGLKKAPKGAAGNGKAFDKAMLYKKRLAEYAKPSKNCVNPRQIRG